MSLSAKTETQPSIKLDVIPAKAGTELFVRVELGPGFCRDDDHVHSMA
jgi:hypothetical protein